MPDDRGLLDINTYILKSSWAAFACLRLAQTRPVTIGLGLSSKQCRQLALLLRNKYTDHLAAHLRHSDALPVGNAFQPDEHGCRHVELHRVLPTRSVLGRRPRTHDDRIFDAECVHVSSPDPLDTATTAVVGWFPNFLVTEQTHSEHARPAWIPWRSREWRHSRGTWLGEAVQRSRPAAQSC